ncbi:MAG TPA: PRC-barrel domain-containing protein [Thermomicrobiales bacterium]|nr:PRC-barrel domain-containing protein [Thermomicrobiales bacterium]
MSTKLVKGTSVVSLADGTELGAVEHVYLDPERKRVVAFSFKSGGGLFGGKSVNLVDVTDVHAIGPDAVTITGASAVSCEMAVGDKCNGLVELDELLKRKVMTDTGEEVGQMAAIHFEQGSYRLSGIDVTSGHLRQNRESISADRIARIGDDLVLISAESTSVESNRARPRQGERSLLLQTVA